MAFYLFTKFEEPVKVFSIGHFFVWEVRPGEKRLFRITNVDYLNYVLEGELGALARTGDVTIDNLVPEENVMNTFLVGVKGPVKVYLRQPLTIAKWGVGAIPGYVTQETSPYINPNPATFTVVMHDTKFAINVENILNEKVSYSIRFTGYKYQIESLAKIKEIDPATGAVKYEKLVPFPSGIVQEVLRLWLMGKIPELTTTGISATR